MEKIKLFLESEKGKDILTVLIVVLVGLGSFELGRLSIESAKGGQTSQPAQTVNQNDDQNSNATQSDGSTQTSMQSPNVELTSSGKTFFASSKGKKYYTITCSAGKTIKTENKVWFATGKEAEAAGYTLSSSCNK